MAFLVTFFYLRNIHSEYDEEVVHKSSQPEPMKDLSAFFRLVSFFLLLASHCLLFGITEPAESEPPIEPTVEHYRYTVAKGDTLWDISQKLLSDPWEWKRIWKQNETIVNPDLIYPEQILLIALNRAEKTLTIIDQPTNKQLENALPHSEIPRLSTTPEKSKARKPAGYFEMQKYDDMIDRKLAESALADKAAFDLSKKINREYNILSLGFVSQSRYIAAGKIEYLEKPSIMISEGDYLFVSFQNPKSVVIGDKLYLIRKTADIIHPSTQKNMGILIQKTGEIQILEKTEKAFRAKVTQSFNYIVIQDRVFPFAPLKTTVVPKVSSTQIMGAIVGAYDDRFVSGTNDVIFLDKGVESGIEVGNLLSALKVYKDPDSGTELTRESGQLIVIDVADEVSIALVINANDTVIAGDYFRTSQ
jgi:hypothetical protein